MTLIIALMLAHLCGWLNPFTFVALVVIWAARTLIKAQPLR